MKFKSSPYILSHTFFAYSKGVWKPIHISVSQPRQIDREVWMCAVNYGLEIYLPNYGLDARHSLILAKASLKLIGERLPQEVRWFVDGDAVSLGDLLPTRLAVPDSDLGFLPQ